MTDDQWLSEQVRLCAEDLVSSSPNIDLSHILELALHLAEASGDTERSSILRAELEGYDAVGCEVPSRRQIRGYASPFPVRALAYMDAEEIFVGNCEKFSQITLTVGQPVTAFEDALIQTEPSGALAFRVPAAEVTGTAAILDDDTEVYIYVLPREVRRLVADARLLVMNTLIGCVVTAATGKELPMSGISLAPLEPGAGRGRRLPSEIVAPEPYDLLTDSSASDTEDMDPSEDGDGQ